MAQDGPFFEFVQQNVAQVLDTRWALQTVSKTAAATQQQVGVLEPEVQTLIYPVWEWLEKLSLCDLLKKDSFEN